MKSTVLIRAIMAILLGAIIVVLVRQSFTIADLRADAAALRVDLKTLTDRTLDNTNFASLEAAQALREKMEVIRLRNQVRELKESVVEAHTSERTAGLRNVLGSIFPQAPPSPGKLRPEWARMAGLATNQYAGAMKALNGNTNEYARFLSLSQAAKMSLAVGHTDDARKLANDLLMLDDKFSSGDPAKANGDAIHTGNVVLGRIALDEGHVDEAKKRLLAAGTTSGSPVLGSFGPNMALARELLEKGDPETVLQYLEMCRKFWKSDMGKLDQWKKDIEAGRIPDFGSNLLY